MSLDPRGPYFRSYCSRTPRISGAYSAFGASDGGKAYASTFGGLSISDDSGVNWTTYTAGLGSTQAFSVFVDGGNVYVGTDNGLGISDNGGTSFTKKAVGNGLGSDIVANSFAIADAIYAATDGGVSISLDGGDTWSNKTTANGLNHDSVQDVFVTEASLMPNERTVYAATYGGGIAISTDGGDTFTSKTTTDGLADDNTNNVYACDHCGIATVSNDAGTEGTVSAIGAGGTTVTATLDEISGSEQLTVN